MGLNLIGDFETTAGSTKKAYARIDGYRIDKVSSKVKFSVTYWLDKEKGKNFNRVYLDEKLKNATGLFANQVVIYKKDDIDGTEYELPTFIVVDMVKEESVEIPIYGAVTTSKEIPYVSFDENGDEVTKYRTLELTSDEQVGKKVETKKVVDNSIIGNLPNFCYEVLKHKITDVCKGIKVEND